MKKIVYMIALVAGLTACQSDHQKTYAESQVSAFPKAYYDDWDRAIRVDTDMQNMYLNTPRRIKKPIDMYMAMALALKFNYTRRMTSYEENLAKAGSSTYADIQDILNKAGYINTSNSSNLSPDLKVAWNILDMSSVYFQNLSPELKQKLAMEQSRKVIHNVLQETRSLYWKTLTAQRLLPVIDDMTEYMTLEVDEMNATAKELAAKGEAPTQEELQKKRKYMEAVQQLTDLKHRLETAQINLAALLGLHPSTEFTLVGAEYGNFEIPEINTNLNQLEWMALSNRPELRSHDFFGSDADKEFVISRFNENKGSNCRQNIKAYDKCSKISAEYGLDMLEDMTKAGPKTAETLRRERLTSIILNQVYVSWAGYMAAMEDYQIKMEIAGTSENIAEDLTFTNGAENEQSQLEAARAIIDEVKSFMSYVDVQDALGNLYATLGLDAMPYYMLGEKLSDIASHLRDIYQKWGQGDLIPDNRPYLMDVPTKRPPLELSKRAHRLKDVTIETGEPISIDVPLDLFDGIGFKGNIVTKAGLIDDAPLPRWISYNPEAHRFTGRALAGNGGIYHIKVYGIDENGNVAYDTFKLTVREVYTPTIEMRGLTEGRQATVFARRDKKQPSLDKETLGSEVEKRPY